MTASIVSAGLFGRNGDRAINAPPYERSRSIWPAVVSHGVNNAIAFVLAAVVLHG